MPECTAPDKSRPARSDIGPGGLGDDRRAPGATVDAVDVGRQFRLGFVALVIAGNAEHRVGEPDRAVRFDDDIVR